MKNKGIIAVVVVLLVVAGAVVAMRTNNSSKDADTNTTSTVVKPKSNQNTVNINSFVFSPENVTVKVGTKVTWTNKDNVGHTVTADTLSSDAPASETFGENETYSFTFSKAGTYAYHCKIHPDMKGTVTVTE